MKTPQDKARAEKFVKDKYPNIKQDRFGSLATAFFSVSDTVELMSDFHTEMMAEGREKMVKSIEEILKPEFMNTVFTWKQIKDAIKKHLTK